MHHAESVRKLREGVVADENALCSEVALGGVEDLRDVHVGERHAAKDAVVLFPEASLELQPHLSGVQWSCCPQRVARLIREVIRDACEDVGRKSANAVIRRLLVLSAPVPIADPN